jgi:hypothetical protein
VGGHNCESLKAALQTLNNSTSEPGTSVRRCGSGRYKLRINSINTDNNEGTVTTPLIAINARANDQYHGVIGCPGERCSIHSRIDQCQRLKAISMILEKKRYTA